MSKARDVKEPDKKAIQSIINNYKQNEKALVEQLYFTASHGTTIGGFREDIWKGMFEQIIPKKFSIEQSVFIIDSEGRISNEVDLAIFDETYTPYIFRYGKLKFIPIEAVAVVVECKSLSLTKENLCKWVSSIKPLETSIKSYTRIASGIIAAKTNSTQTRTRPLRILCALNKSVSNRNSDNGECLFDIIISAPPKEKGLSIEFDEQKVNLQDWYLALNHVGYHKDDNDVAGSRIEINEGNQLADLKLTDYQVSGTEGAVSLLSFNLQLNQLLMLINNPIPFPHVAYAQVFNRFAKEEKEDD